MRAPGRRKAAPGPPVPAPVSPGARDFRAGFHRVELLVVLGALVALAGVLLPTVKGELEAGMRSEAYAEAHRLAVAVSRYLQDTSEFPDRARGKQLAFLYTPGDAPHENSFGDGESAPIESFLVENGNRAKGWKGPYIDQARPDPWGRRYVVNVRGFADDEQHVWVLSAGPDGAIETDPYEMEPAGDDIGLFIR